SFLGTPIVSPAKVYGWLCLIDKVGADEFPATDERIAGILAAQLGRTYENGTLYDELLRHAANLELEVGERKRAEAALRASEELFRSAFERTNVAMGLAGLDGRFLRVNEAFARLLGYARDDLLQRSQDDITHP